MRDHQPILIEEFNGLWKRGDDEAVPLDHSSDVQNITFFEQGFRTRDGITAFIIDEEDCINLSNVRRIYSYVFGGNHNSLLVLDTLGNIYHTASPTPCVPILSIPDMTDFSYVSISGRAYITPHDGTLGLINEFIYVYLGAGDPARKAAGVGPTTAVTATESAVAGNVEAGIHVYGVVYETDTGFLTKISPLTTLNSTGGFEVDITNVPIAPNTFTVARHIVASRAINPTLYTGNPDEYQLFFVPDGTLPDNIQTTISVSFFDADLLDDASHLLDILEEIPASVAINTYHDRMVIGGIFASNNKEWSLVRLSVPGEPEAFDAVDGLFYVPADDYPITYLQEYRDVLYIFKIIRTYASVDNGGEPSEWPTPVTIDQGLGASVHGVAAVLDSGGINIEFLIITNYAGIFIFNGSFAKPELTYKIKDYWTALDRAFFTEIQIVNDTIEQIIYCTLPNFRLLVGFYENGLDAKAIKWSIWLFDNQVTTITLIDTNTLIIGSLAVIP
jgi:hypothetical protein